jgi:DNA polymerase-3 subunit epsilon
MSKMLFFDLETTGTNPAKHSIHQISGKIIINGKVEDEFDIHMQPNPLAQIEDEALAVAGVTREQIATYVPFSAGYNMFVGHLQPWIDKYDKKRQNVPRWL